MQNYQGYPSRFFQVHVIGMTPTADTDDRGQGYSGVVRPRSCMAARVK